MLWCPRRRRGLWRHRILLLWLRHDAQTDDSCDALGLLHTRQAQSPLSKVRASPMRRTRSLRSSWIGASLFPHMSVFYTRAVVGVVDNFENEVFFEIERRRFRVESRAVQSRFPKIAPTDFRLANQYHDPACTNSSSFIRRFGVHLCHDVILMITN